MSLEELEKLRKKAKNIILIGLFLSLISGIILSVMMNSISFLFGTFVVGMIITIILDIKPKRKCICFKIFKNDF